jgi:hypothetical protein
MTEIVSSNVKYKEIANQGFRDFYEDTSPTFFEKIDESEQKEQNEFQAEYTQRLRRCSQEMISKEDQEYIKEDEDDLSDDEREVTEIIENTEKNLDSIQDFLEMEKGSLNTMKNSISPPRFPIEKLVSAFIFTILVVSAYVVPQQQL